MPNQAERTACHEAGHAVTVFVQGIDAHGIDVRRESVESRNGACHAVATVSTVADQMEKAIALRDDSLAAFRSGRMLYVASVSEHLTSLYAGVVAEEILVTSGIAHSANHLVTELTSLENYREGNDIKRAEELAGLRILGFSRFQARPYLAWIHARAVEMVGWHWHAVRELADRLVEAEELAGAEVTKIISDSLDRLEQVEHENRWLRLSR
jgi:uncharacterized protein YqfB (UPF0267 family)